MEQEERECRKSLDNLTMAVILLAAFPPRLEKLCGSVWIWIWKPGNGVFHQDEVMTRIISEMTGTRHAFTSL